MSQKTFLIYPCGKKIEIRIPITANDESGKLYSILPGDNNYFKHAKIKFEINNLKVIEEDVPDLPIKITTFISLTRKVRSVE